MTILIADAFTASNTTPISGRTPDTTVSGRTWATGKFTDVGAPGGVVEILFNSARINTSFEGFAIDCGANDYSITWYVTLPSSGQFRGGVRFRMQTGLPFTSTNDVDYYFWNVRYDLASGQVNLSKFVDNTETTIGTATDFSFSYSTTYKHQLIVSGTSYTFYIDDALVKSSSDSTYSTGSIVGFSSAFLSGNDFYYDSIQIDSLGGTIFRRGESDRAGSRS